MLPVNVSRPIDMPSSIESAELRELSVCEHSFDCVARNQIPKIRVRANKSYHYIITNFYFPFSAVSCNKIVQKSFIK